MADIAAPYFSGNDLTARPGDAALSGVAADFDPANKAPFAGMNQTFERLGSEAQQTAMQRRQQAFQAQQQENQFQHDLLSKKMDMEQQMKMLQYKKGLEDRDDFYRMMSDMRVRGGNLKDPNGNPMPLVPLEEDQPYLQKNADELNKMVLANPSGYKYDSEFQKKFTDFDRQTANATARSRYAKEAQIALTQTADPDERENIASYINGLKKSSVSEVPAPYVSKRLTFQPIVDQSKFKDKDMQQFDEGKGVPQSQYSSLLYTNDGKQIDQGFRTYQAFKAMPQGQDPQAYQAYQTALNDLQAKRGQPAIDLGGRITNDGKVVFDDASRAKQLEQARKFLYADQLMHSGHITPFSEDEVMESQKLKEQVAKERASAQKDSLEAAIKQRELETGKSLKPTTEELKQEQTVKAVKAVNTKVQDLYNTDSQAPRKIAYPSYWKRQGIDPDEYDIYKELPSTVADKYIGIEAPETSTKTTDKKEVVTTKTAKGETEKSDKAYLVKNKSTGDKEIVYFKDNAILARVPEKDAVINGLKADAKFDPAKYGDHVAWVDDVYGKADNAAQPAGQKQGNANNSDDQEAAIRARLVPIQIKTKGGKIVTVMKDPQTGKRYAAQ